MYEEGITSCLTQLGSQKMHCLKSLTRCNESTRHAHAVCMLMSWRSMHAIIGYIKYNLFISIWHYLYMHIHHTSHPRCAIILNNPHSFFLFFFLFVFFLKSYISSHHLICPFFLLKSKK